jgi:hypothetical protein
MKSEGQLVEEAKKLLDLAEEVQDEARSAEEREASLKDLSDRYHDWYQAALALFDARKQPGERQKFEQEYSGSFWSPKIIRFLTEGTQISPIHDPDNPLLANKWTYPFNGCFKEPLFKQRSILAGLKPLPSTATADGGGDNAWNATICRIFRAFIDKAEGAKTNHEKKLTYEYLAIFLIGSIDGFTLIGHDQRGASEEVDLWVANESESAFWQRMGNPFIVECKNWDKPVGATEIRNLSAIMSTKNVQFALYMCKNGITGNPGRDAVGEIYNAFKDGRYVLVLDQTDLLEVADGVHPEEKIKAKLYDLFMKS